MMPTSTSDSEPAARRPGTDAPSSVLVEGVAQVAITDEGPGIPPEWREQIFEPYARRQTLTARGSGIGLYAARSLAKSMGGRLWCEPAPSGGARFVLALPAAVAV